MKEEKRVKFVFKQANWYLNDGLTIAEIKEKIKHSKSKKRKKENSDHSNEKKDKRKSPWINIISTPMRD